MRACCSGATRVLTIASAIVVLLGCTAGEPQAGEESSPGIAVTETPASSAEPQISDPAETPGDASPTAEPSDSEENAVERPSAASAEPECVAIADDLIIALQAAADEAGDAPIGAVLEGDALSAETRARLEELRARATADDCDAPVLSDLLRLRADRIEGDGMLARLVRNVLRAGGDLPL